MKKRSLFLNILFLTLIMATLPSCRVDGLLNVDDGPLSLKGSGGGSYTYPAGSYESWIKFVSQKTVLRMGIYQGDKLHRFDFPIPEGTEIPDQDGEIFVPASENGQDYDILAKVKFQESKGEVIEDWEPCHCTETPALCFPSLPYEGFSYYGRRFVKYYWHTTQRNYTLEFLSPTVASFKGVHLQGPKKVYLRLGFCM